MSLMKWIGSLLPSRTRVVAFPKINGRAYSNGSTGQVIKRKRNGAQRPAQRLGAVGDIQRYLQRVRPTETLLMLGADNVFDGRLDALAEAAHRGPAVLVSDVGSPELASRYASVVLDATGTILRMVEKDPAPPSSLAVTALYGLPAAELPSVAEYLATGGSADRMGSFMEWLAARRPVRGIHLHGRWIDIGSAEELARARSWFQTAQ